jgi:hypothetical protein
MKTLLIPKFDINSLKFLGHKEVKIKNNPNTKDYNKVVEQLPGFPQGYCPSIYNILISKKPLEITSFYDKRQRGSRKLKGYFITVKNA